MKKPWVEREALEEVLSEFVKSEKADIRNFGSTVNQAFEAFVFVSTVAWYRERGWDVEFVNPSGEVSGFIKLKYSTRGRPANYSYAVCRKEEREVHIRHQMRVATRAHRPTQRRPANICLDVAVLEPVDVSLFKTSDFIETSRLVTFAEAKHMSAFAELVAGFVGLVHELQPARLKRVRIGHRPEPEHPAPFLYVSGTLYYTGEGVFETIQRRKYDIDLYTRTESLTASIDSSKILKKKEVWRN